MGPELPFHVDHIGALRVALPQGRPLVINQKSGDLTIPCHVRGRELYIIGNVTLSKGYPTDGTMGDIWGKYELAYEDGSHVIVPLHNGIELTTIWGSFGSSPIDPRGTNVTRAFTLIHDPNWEIYHANLLRLPIDPTKTLCSITCALTASDTTLLLYGITAK